MSFVPGLAVRPSALQLWTLLEIGMDNSCRVSINLRKIRGAVARSEVVRMLGRHRDHAESHGKADSLARHSWAGEYSSSGPSRVHVLHSIEEKRWHEGGLSCHLWYTAACMQCQRLAHGKAVDALCLSPIPGCQANLQRLQTSYRSEILWTTCQFCTGINMDPSESCLSLC